ncbi:MAG: hypothetical protein KQI35_06095 [Bacteroidetes bacterium]|nr:hypothetical protein [Bacteroidota bacterium]
MKTRSVIFIGILALLLSSCLVKSLHPFFKEQDVVYNPKLLGTYLDGDSATWNIKQHVFSRGFMKGDTADNSYLVEMIDEDGVQSNFNAHMFDLNGMLFLDFFPILDDRYDNFSGYHLVPVHSLARIQIESANRLVISWFDEEWLNTLFEENRVKISHEVIQVGDYKETKEYVLTASTNELQKFISKYGKENLPEDCNESSDGVCVTLNRVK